MRITVISTYPEEGSKNIGDALITQTTCSALYEILGTCHDLHIATVWRADIWKNVRTIIEKSDFIIFACLAIRPEMENIEYPYLLNIMDSGIPYGILAAGTALLPDRKTKDQGFPNETLRILKILSDNAHFFTTRGVLTQHFCQENQLSRARFVGDIAFYGSNLYQSQEFGSRPNLKKIAISDPHYSPFYIPVFSYLINQTKSLFPDAEIIVFLHGKNPTITNFLLNHPEIICRKIYEDKDQGLDAYEDIDLHLGFRVHGHVSALKRKKASYLLEQDGRGLDYGLTICQRISVPCPIINKLNLSFKNIFWTLVRRSKRHLYLKEASCNSVDHLLAILKQDWECGFKKFHEVEIQMKEFDLNNREALSTIKYLEKANNLNSGLSVST